jgi:peptidoglycan/xylan/chitin deacetylase (PgdA/CDA1 family)
MLNAPELRSLNSGGIEVGSHTVGHPRLTGLAPQEVRMELRSSKSQLEDVLGRPVEHFAYPFGNYNDAVRDAVADAGYSSACSTRWGKRHTASDLFALRRVEVQGRDSLFQFALKLRIATNHMPPIPEARHLLRQGLEKTGILDRRPARDSY